MSFKAKTYLDFPVNKIAQEYDHELDLAIHAAAKLGQTTARSEFRRKYQRLEPYRHTEHVRSLFRVMKSKYPDRKNPNWLFGVFGSAAREWEETIGGRSLFFEYGRSAPGRGRLSLHEDASTSRRLYKMTGGNDAGSVRGSQPPRPFMRIAKSKLLRKYPGITAKQLARLARKLNRRVK